MALFHHRRFPLRLVRAAAATTMLGVISNLAAGAAPEWWNPALSWIAVPVAIVLIPYAIWSEYRERVATQRTGVPADDVALEASGAADPDLGDRTGCLLAAPRSQPRRRRRRY